MNHCAAVFGAISLFLLATAIGFAQGPPGDEVFPPAQIEARAKAAKASDPHSVRALVDAVFDNTLLATSSEALKDRVYAADLAFRAGRHAAISEKDLAKVANKFARKLAAPEFAQTSVAQVHAFREMVRQLVPHLGAENGTPRPISSEMTPLEAIYVSAALAAQKMHNEDFQVPPNEWAQAYRMRKEKGVEKPKEKYGKVTRMHPDVSRLARVIDRDLSNDFSEVGAAVHQFLDELGISR